MPALTDSRKRSLTPDSSVSGSGSDNDTAPSASKRLRSNGNHANGSVLPSSYRSDGAAHPQQLSHQPGSLVRVTLRDFVTYTRAEFNLGPSLNMVIGPNGTGKSTLVCAICLGLGWKTEHLGRAKDVGEFVKHGASEAEIEIELAADPQRHRRNPVVKLNIKKGSNKTTFFLNGKPVPRKAILDECKAFSIQIDNLCQFLPQDRVVEFAALSNIDLLTQTQRAAAPPEMSDMHERLKDLHGQHRKALDDQQTNADTLKRLEDRQSQQRSDVERIQQRADYKEQLEALDLYRPRLQYQAAKAKFDDIKVRLNDARSHLQQLEQELGPALAQENGKISYCAQVEKSTNQCKRVLKRCEEDLAKELKKQEDLATKIKDLQTIIDSEGDRRKQRLQERARLENGVRTLEIQLREGPPPFDATDYNERIRDLTRDIRDIGDREGELRDKLQGCKARIKSRNDRVAALQREIEALNSQAGQRMSKLNRASRDTGKAWDWVQKNTHLFEKEVYGPPMISLNVKDPKHAIYVESVMQFSDYLGITAQTPADFDLLQDKLAGELGLKDVYIRSVSGDMSRYRRPVANDQLAPLGLGGYIIDLIDAPGPVLSMLCETRNIHQTAVAFRNLSDDQYNAVTRSSISSFVTPSESYTITRRREYGDRGASTRTRKVMPPRFFTDQQADTSAERELKQQILEVNGEIEGLKEEMTAHNDSIQKLRPRLEELTSKKTDIEAEKSNKQAALSNYNGLATKLETAKSKVAEKDQQLAKQGEERLQKQREIAELLVKKAEGGTMYATLARTLHTRHVELIKAELQLIEGKSDLENLQARCAEVHELLDERRKMIEELETAKVDARTLARNIHDQYSRVMAGMTERQKEIHNEQPEDLTLEALEEKIVALQARLELVHEGNPDVMRQYEERARNIDKTRDKLREIDAQVETIGEQIQEIRDEWEPQLDALIGKISDAFGDNMSRINCAGQVEVEKTDDFASWAILIKVKFREEEQLSVLDAHRQSGGERAVSTIFYLMALQSLARAPFRVVDEINQGMDPRNERLVHSRMVSIACAENTSQYFLITPKLLPDLQYHPNMKIHCIASGEYLPDDYNTLNFQALAKKALGIRRGISSQV